MRAALDKTPPPKGPPPIDVRVPVAKAIPQGAVEYRVLCMSNRVYMINPFGFRTRVWTELEKARYDLLFAKQPADSKAPPVFDHLKTVTWLNERKYADEYVELKFPLDTNSMTDRVTMQILPRADGGESPTIVTASAADSGESDEPANKKAGSRIKRVDRLNRFENRGHPAPASRPRSWITPAPR